MQVILSDVALQACKNQIRLSNQAALIKSETRFLSCISNFTPKIVWETYFRVLFHCDMKRFVTQAPPNSQYFTHQPELLMVLCLQRHLRWILCDYTMMTNAFELYWWTVRNQCFKNLININTLNKDIWASATLIFSHSFFVINSVQVQQLDCPLKSDWGQLDTLSWHHDISSTYRVASCYFKWLNVFQESHHQDDELIRDPLKT